VTLSKKFIPENQGTDYNVLREFVGEEDRYGLVALGDGHASAWAHACHPDFAGKDIVVLAIGTGLGFGHVREGKIVMGPEGLYSRLNDLPGPGGKTYEQLLGGFFLSKEPSEELKQEASEAIHHAIRMVSTFLFPDVVIICGTVGMQPWLNLELEPKEGWPNVPVVRSPFGADAGLYGAAAVALYPPFEPER
jgi:N-acetylmannosamine-6-phosphate 2-epimerase/N-acetylmannosamine kinase